MIRYLIPAMAALATGGCSLLQGPPLGPVAGVHFVPSVSADGVQSFSMTISGEGDLASDQVKAAHRNALERQLGIRQYCMNGYELDAPDGAQDGRFFGVTYNGRCK